MNGIATLLKSIFLCVGFRLLLLMLLFGAVLSLRGQTATVNASAGEIVATTLIFEAGGEVDDHGMVAVYEVIRNRAHAQNKTEIQVCLARKQFSCWNGVTDVAKLVAKARKHPRWADAMYVYMNGKQTNFTKGATFYHSNRIAPPKWAAYSHKTCEIGNHIFYK